MTARTPVADIAEEARRVLAGCTAGNVTARLIGGLAVAWHQHETTPPGLQRSYADIDLVIGRKEGRAARNALLQLGYVPDDGFNALHGDRRLLFYDGANGRQLDVFIGKFAMCHALELSGRLTMLPDTLSVADLLLTKLQIVEINAKDLIDTVQLLRNHAVSREDRPGSDELSLDRLCAVTSADWGWYTTFGDNLAKAVAFAPGNLDEPDRGAVAARVEAIQQAVDQAAKSLRWKARARIGRHSPWYELPEEVAGIRHG
jgi:hypothetical protein